MILFRRVIGHSMEPTLKEGQYVWAHQVRNFKPGQIVIAHIGSKEVIKRIAKVESGTVYLTGDNKSHDHDIGNVVDSMIVGVVFWPRV